MVEFALLSKNHGKRSKKYGTLRGRLKRFLTENGTVRYGHGKRINSEPLLYLHSLEKKSIFSFLHIPILGYTFELSFTNGVMSDREAVIFFWILHSWINNPTLALFWFRPYFEKFFTLKLKLLKNAFGTLTLKPYRTVNTHPKATINSSFWRK